MSQARPLKKIADESQETINERLIKYCEQNARDLALIEQLKKGICGGLCALDAYSNTIYELDEKSDLPLPKDDLVWLNDIKYKLSNWKLNKPFPNDPEDPFVQDIERFLAQLISLGNYVYSPLTLRNWDFETLLLDTHNRTFKSVLRFAAPMTREQVGSNLKYFTPPGTWTMISAGAHATSLKKKKGIHSFFDPNARAGRKQFEEDSKNNPNLASQIFIRHAKYNFPKSFIFRLASYRLERLHEAKTEEKTATPEEKSSASDQTVMRLLKSLNFESSPEKSKILNDKRSQWLDISTLTLALESNLPTAAIQYYLDQGADPNIQDDTKSTPLHWCVAHRHKPEFISTLLQAGANPTLRDTRYTTPISLALYNTARFCHQNNPLNTKEQLTEFEYYSQILNLFHVDKTVIESLKNKENFDLLCKIDTLHYKFITFSTAHQSSTATSKETLSAKLDELVLQGKFNEAYEFLMSQISKLLDKASEDGITLLFFAVKYAHTDLTMVALTKLQSSLKEEPAKLALAIDTNNKFVKLAYSLFKYNQDNPDYIQKMEINLLLKDVFKLFECNAEIAYTKLKEQSQAYLNKPNALNMLPLTWAARTGNIGFIEAFLDASEEDKSTPEAKSVTKSKVNINQRDPQKKSPLFYAVLRLDFKLIELLLKKGAKPDKDYEYNPLLQAIRVREFALAKRLCPDCNIDAIKSNFIAFKKLDRLAQRLIAAVAMYYADFKNENSKRTEIYRAIIASITAAYDLVLKSGDGDKAYQQLLFGNPDSAKESKEPMIKNQGIVAMLNNVINDHRSSRYQRVLMKFNKGTQSRLEQELEEALVDSGLNIIKNARGNIISVEPTTETRMNKITPEAAGGKLMVSNFSKR